MEKAIKSAKPKLPPVRIVKTVEKIRSGFSKVNKAMVPPPVALLEMITGAWVAQSIGVAAKLGVADQIGKNENATASALASKVGADEEALYRLLRALSMVGLFKEHEGRAFSLTAIGHCLRTDHPQSMRHMAIFQGDFNWPHWGALEHCVKTGTNAVEKVRGMKPFEFLGQNKDTAEVFDKAMVNISKMELDSILAVYDFSQSKIVADVGGGYGAFLSAILSTHPKLEGILFDLPHVVKGAAGYIDKAGLTGRIKTQGGSFFDSAPRGADTYMMKHIIHDWSDAESITILKNIRSQIPLSGRLLLFETVIPGPSDAHFSKFLDLEMLVVTTGKERTEKEYRDLLARGGFKLERIVPTISMASVIEARPL